MNNRENLKKIIEYYGGSASVDDIIQIYARHQYVLINQQNKDIILRTLKSNKDLFRFNCGNDKWELRINSSNDKYLYVSDMKYFATIEEAMLYVFNQKPRPRHSYFNINGSKDYAWFPKFDNANPEWTNVLVDEGKTWKETPHNLSAKAKEENRHLQEFYRYVFAYEKSPSGKMQWRFTGKFKETSVLDDDTRVYSLVDDKVEIVQKEELLLVCRITYMKYYDGITDEDKPVNGGSFVTDNADAFEKNNFHKYSDGYCYGFVETKYKGGNTANNQFARSTHIENIDANYKDKSSISGVRVVFAARSPIKNGMVVIGWYDNATVYRDRIIDNDLMYNIKCLSSDAHLIEEVNRNFMVPAATSSPIGIGQSNFWYIQKNLAAKDYEKQLVEYINSFSCCEDKNIFYEPVNLLQFHMFDVLKKIGDKETFLATSEMKIGDYLLLHVGSQDSKYESGIYGVVKVVSTPYIYHGNEDEHCNNNLSVDTEVILISNKVLMPHNDFTKYVNQFRSRHKISNEYYTELRDFFNLE